MVELSAARTLLLLILLTVLLPAPTSAAAEVGASPSSGQAVKRDQSRLLGAAAADVVRATDGHCAVVDGLTTCTTGWLRLYGRGGTTYGDTFVSAQDVRTVAARPSLIAHEKYHRDEQWRRHGLGFSVRYVGAEIIDRWVMAKRCNRYETPAETAGHTGYACDSHPRHL